MGKGKEMATIKQIAALAGVSRGTVDRVLNNRGGVNKETADRICEIAQSLGYVPNKVARSLSIRKKEVKLGYVLFPPSKNPFFAQVEEGINQKISDLAEYGVEVLVRYGDYNDVTYQIQLMDELVKAGVSGLAFCGFNTPEIVSKIDELSNIGIPVVTANTDIPESKRIAYVGSDYEKSGKVAGSLMSMVTGGTANVAAFLGSRNILCHTMRLNGFRSYIAQHGYNIKLTNVVENNDDDFLTFSLVRELLTNKNNPQVDAIFLAAAGTFGACRAVEMLPEQDRPKVICYDCLPQVEHMLKNGLISAAICQQPVYQGSKPLDILFNKICLEIKPEKEFYYTNIEILVDESL